VGKVCVELNEEELARLVKAAEEAGFKDVKEFVKFLVEEATSAVEIKEEDVREVVERLRSLGYL